MRLFGSNLKDKMYYALSGLNIKQPWKETSQVRAPRSPQFYCFNYWFIDFTAFGYTNNRIIEIHENKIKKDKGITD